MPENNEPTPEQVALVDAEGKFAENWRESLDEDIRGEECLNLITDFPGAMKQLVHAKRVVGKDKVVVPTDKSGPEEWEAFYRAAGRPETPDDYPAEVKEGLSELFTPEKIAQYRTKAHELGVSKKQFEGWLNFEMEAAARALEAEAGAAQEAKDNAENVLREKLGGAYDERMHVANKLVNEIFKGRESEMLPFLEKFGNDPDFILFASDAGSRLVEHKGLIAKLTTDTPGDAKAKIAELEKIYTDPKATAEEKEAASQKIREYYKIAYPEPEKQQAFSGIGG